MADRSPVSEKQSLLHPSLLPVADRGVLFFLQYQHPYISPDYKLCFLLAMLRAQLLSKMRHLLSAWHWTIYSFAVAIQWKFSSARSDQAGSVPVTRHHCQ